MNGLSTLLPFLIMQVATSAPTTTFPARIDAAAGAGPTVQGGASRGASTAFAIGLDWYYRRPIVEDAAPFGLQAYLQRLDAISLGLQAGGFGAKRDVEEDHSRTFGARLGWLGHWRRYLFAGEAAYEHIDEQQRFTATGGEASRRAHVVRPSLSLGIRDQAFELRATYLWPLAVEGEAFSVPTWRAFALSGRLVLEHAQSLSLGLYTLPNNGAGASATYEYFHGRRVSLWLRALRQRAVLSSDPV